MFQTMWKLLIQTLHLEDHCPKGSWCCSRWRRAGCVALAPTQPSAHSQFEQRSSPFFCRVVRVAFVLYRCLTASTLFWGNNRRHHGESLSFGDRKLLFISLEYVSHHCWGCSELGQQSLGDELCHQQKKGLLAPSPPHLTPYIIQRGAQRGGVSQPKHVPREAVWWLPIVAALPALSLP